MNLNAQINDLIDEHVEIPYMECPGCEKCKGIQDLSKQLERTPEQRYQHILSKGPEMTTRQVSIMITNGVPKETIVMALGKEVNADVIYRNLKPKRSRAKEKAISPDEYIECRRQHMTHAMISEQYDIDPKTIGMNVRDWLKSGAISQEVHQSLPKTKLGPKKGGKKN